MSNEPETQTLYDKPISLVSQAGERPGRLVAVLSGSDYTVEISCGPISSRHTAWNLFTALGHVRDELEPHGLKPAIEGACVDVYPSRMALDMGGGRRAYRWSSAGRPVTVDIFDDVPPSDHVRLVDVREQRTAHERRRETRNG